jgi:transposase-like protein
LNRRETSWLPPSPYCTLNSWGECLTIIDTEGFSAAFKFQVALEAAKGTKTLNELSSEYSVHPNQISGWKRELLESAETLFSNKGARRQREQEALQTELYEQIGRLNMELEWLKKKATRYA